MTITMFALSDTVHTVHTIYVLLLFNPRTFTADFTLFAQRNVDDGTPKYNTIINKTINKNWPPIIKIKSEPE